MASVISQAGQPQNETRPFYCHQCSHQWMKTQNSLFECPRCREGFIEEVTDDFQPDLIDAEPNGDLASILDLLNDDETDSDDSTDSVNARIIPPSSNVLAIDLTNSPEPSQSQNRARVSFVVEAFNDNRETNNRQGRMSTGRRGFRNYLSFMFGDMMSSIVRLEQHPAMSDAQLQEIPKATITSEQTKDQLSCSICLTDFKIDDSNIRKLQCNHFFHETCIFPWLRNNASCPVCRTRLRNSNRNELNDNDIETFFQVMGQVQRRNRGSSLLRGPLSARRENEATATSSRPSRAQRNNTESSRQPSTSSSTVTSTRAASAAAAAAAAAGSSSSMSSSRERTTGNRQPAVVVSRLPIRISQSISSRTRSHRDAVEQNSDESSRRRRTLQVNVRPTSRRGASHADSSETNQLNQSNRSERQLQRPDNRNVASSSSRGTTGSDANNLETETFNSAFRRQRRALQSRARTRNVITVSISDSEDEPRPQELPRQRASRRRVATTNSSQEAVPSRRRRVE